MADNEHTGHDVKGPNVENTVRKGEYAPAGEESGGRAIFTLEDIASAFAMEPDRVQRAMRGEFGSVAIPVATSHGVAT